MLNPTTNPPQLSSWQYYRVREGRDSDRLFLGRDRVRERGVWQREITDQGGSRTERGSLIEHTTQCLKRSSIYGVNMSVDQPDPSQIILPGASLTE